MSEQYLIQGTVKILKELTGESKVNSKNEETDWAAMEKNSVIGRQQQNA